MKPVRENHEGYFCADILIALQSKPMSLFSVTAQQVIKPNRN
jgi:hypothetical protein